MAYTQSDLDNIQAALVELATGKRRVRVSMGGKLIEYGQVDIQSLKNLRSEISTEIEAATGVSSFYLTTTKKRL
jgi:hypothetical protein